MKYPNRLNLYSFALNFTIYFIAKPTPIIWLYMLTAGFSLGVWFAIEMNLRADLKLRKQLYKSLFVDVFRSSQNDRSN